MAESINAGPPDDDTPEEEHVIDRAELRRRGIPEDRSETAAAAWEAEELERQCDQLEKPLAEFGRQLCQLLNWSPGVWEGEEQAPPIGPREVEQVRKAIRSELAADEQLELRRLSVRFRSWHELYLRCYRELREDRGA